MFEGDARTFGVSVAIVALAALAIARHVRAWQADARAFETTASTHRPHAVSGTARWLRLGALACLALATASPALRATRPGNAAEPTLAIVLDVSMSMRADDVAPTRLDEAKRQIVAGLDRSFGGRIALVAFAAAPTLVCPPTTDGAAFADLLEVTREDAAVAGLSLAAPAVARAVALVGDGGGDVLLVSDGEFPDEDRRQLQAVANDARRRDVRISTIGVGTTAGAPVPVRDSATGQVQVDGAGQVTLSRLDAAVLQWLAAEGGGQYVELLPGGTIDVVAMTERLRLASTTTPSRLRPFGPVSFFGYPLALGLVLLAIDAWLAWRGRKT